jgi:flavocytochrome c
MVLRFIIYYAVGSCLIDAAPFKGFMQHVGDLEDVGIGQTCDVESVQVANVRQLHPILYDLVNTTFFRLFHVNLKTTNCPYWQPPESEKPKDHSEPTCTGSLPTETSFLGAGGLGVSDFSTMEKAEPPCGVDSEEEQREDSASLLDRSMTPVERTAASTRNKETEESCEFEEDMPEFWVDMCTSKEDLDNEDVNLVKNPERNTGYNGSHIWEAMYNENCFEVGSGLPRGRFGDADNMCYEERVLYRLLSAWHSATSISIMKYFYPPGTKEKGKWSPNLQLFMDKVGRHPERVKNLYFSFVVMLRAIKRAAPLLHARTYITGDSAADQLTRSLMTRLLDSQVLSLCSPLFDAFDETQLFRATTNEHRSMLKKQFKSVFQNITVLVECVQCQRCRLHAKLYSLGLGSALKILLSPPELIVDTMSRDEIVALINVLWKLSEAMDDAHTMIAEYWASHSKPASPDSPKSTPLEAAATQQKSEPVAVPQAAPQFQAMPENPPTFAAINAEARMTYLDAAIGAVRRARASTAIDKVAEDALLQSLVISTPRDSVLLLAKHYAADKPEIFASVALQACPGFTQTTAGVTQIATSGTSALLGSDGKPADVVVIGGGLAGMVVTLSVLDRGGRVVMVEKQPYIGGNSARASSGINAALETSVESLIADTTKSAGALARPDLINILAGESAAAVSWLSKRTAVDLSMRSQLGGHSVMRTLRPANAFVGAEVTFAIGQVLNKAAVERPDQFRLITKAKWTGLERGGSGWRTTVMLNSSEVVLEALSTVIASGGFGHDAREAESLLLKHRPDLEDYPTTLGPHTTGDGVKIARDIGAALVDMDKVQLHPTGFVDPKKPQENHKTLAAELLRGVGGLLLDRNGRRFTNELGTRQAVVNNELEATVEGRSLKDPTPVRTFALVLNGKAAAMADRHVTLYTKKGLLVKVDGYAGIASHLGCDVRQLRETFDSYNDAARSGKDMFNRTTFPSHWPIEDNESFWIGWVVPVIHYTMGGVAIDTEGRVLAKDGKAVLHEGLYAIGEASGGVHGDNRLAGNSLLECTVFGRHVGLALPILRGGNGAAPTIASVAAASSAEAKTTNEAAAESSVRRISLEELSKHKTNRDGTWVALYGKVYDLTDYVAEHPGGEDSILDVAATEATEIFETVHNRELLETMGFDPVGILADA